MLDTSESVAGDKLASLIDAAKTLIASLRPDDHVALITFAEGVAIRQPLGVTAEEVSIALSALSGRGPMVLRDAVYVGLQLRPNDESRPIVLIFSDGDDTCSWVTEDDALASARRAGVVVHAVSLDDSPGRSDVGLPGQSSPQHEAAGSRFLRRIVNAAGGRLGNAEPT